MRIGRPKARDGGGAPRRPNSRLSSRGGGEQRPCLHLATAAGSTARGTPCAGAYGGGASLAPLPGPSHLSALLPA